MRIALATVGTIGDVLPFTALARALVERDHQVTAVTWPVHAAVLSQPGVRVEVAGPHADPARIDQVAARAAASADRSMREAAKALALRVGAEDGIGVSVPLLENAVAAGG